MSLTKLQVKDNNEQTVYVTYSIDELSSITKWTGAGKTLLEEISLEFNNINAQSKALFDKQIEIAAHYQDQLKQTVDKLAQTEAKLTETESKLDSCDGQLLDKTRALETKEKELQDKQEEHNKLLTAYNYNYSSESTNLLEETTHSYENKLKDLKEDLNQKSRQIQSIQEKLEKSETTKNESKQLATKLLDSLESAKKTIEQLQNQNKIQPNRDIIDIEHDELSDLKKRINLLEKIQQNPNPNSTSDRGLLSRQSSVTTESLKTKDNTEEKGIKIEMKTSLPYFTGRSDSMNVGDWLFQSKKIMDLAKYTDAQMVAVGTNHLKDLAATDYILHEKTHGIHKSWPEFSEFMIKKHTPANHNQIIRGKIKNLVQITSIKDYYNEFRMLSLQATDMNEAEKLNAFINGMKPDIRKYVNMQLPKSLENAFDTADLFETFNHERVESSYISTQSSTNNFRNKNKNTNNSNNNTNNSNNSTNNTNNSSNNSNNNSNYNRNNNNNNNNSNNNRNSNNNNNKPKQNNFTQNPYRNETCAKCSIKGHIAEHCRNSLICSKCNLKGHIDIECRQHLLCTTCDRRGHLATRCYKNRTPDITAMALEDDELPKWNAQIKGIDVQVILDSGAIRSFISRSLVDKLNLKTIHNGRHIETATGEIVNVPSTQPVEIIFESIPATIEFNITNISSIQIALGKDWFKQTGVMVDPRNDAFILPQRLVNPIDNSSFETKEEDELDSQLSLLALDDTEIDYIDDSHCFDLEKLDFDLLQPKTCLKPTNLESFNDLLKKYEDIFAATVEQLQYCKNVTFKIETTSETPIFSTPYRQPPKLLKEMKSELDSLLKAGIISPAPAGTWTFPGFMIKQKGKFRFVVNFKSLNKITKLIKFPLPIINELFDSFQGAQFFSIIDCRKGFFQLLIDESTKHKVGVTTPEGVFIFNRVPFGVSNGPTFFSQVMQAIFGDLPFVRVYIDDIGIASKTEEEHLQHIIIVFERLKENNLKINPEKCVFFAIEIKLLGHIIDRNGIKMDPEKVAAIKDRKPPTSLKQVQSWLGLTNYYRRFIRDYAKIVAPLYKLKEKFANPWPQDCQLAFDRLKELVTSYPILRLPDIDRPFIIHCDASIVSLGAVLAQIDPITNLEYACEFASKTLKEHERLFNIAELECMAVAWAINKFRYYLTVFKFTIYTDNAAVKWLFSINNMNSKLMKYSIIISAFDCEILHRAGKNNGNADCLSRPVLLALEDSSKNEDLETFSSKTQDPYEDECLLHFLTHHRHLPGASKKQVKRVSKASLYYKINDDGTMVARNNVKNLFDITIPRLEERLDIVLKEHELGHPKVEKIKQALDLKKIFWKNMRKFIDDVISQCDICIKHERLKLVNNPALALNIDNIFDRMGMDIVMGLPTTHDGYHAILVVVEYLTKFAWAFPLKTKSAEEIVKHLTSLICTWGPPNCLLSDMGKEFLNMIVNKLCDRFQIIRRHTSSYNPRVNGLCERTHQSLTRMLIKLADENPVDWPNQLDIVLLAYRTSVHSSTNYSPFYLMFGRQFGQFDDWLVKEKNVNELAIENRLSQIKQLFDETHEAARKSLTKAQHHQINTQNKQSNASDDFLPPGSKVQTYDCKLVNKKMESYSKGPFTIVKRDPIYGNYTLMDQNGIELKYSFPRWKLKLIKPNPFIETTYNQLLPLSHSSENKLRANPDPKPNQPDTHLANLSGLESQKLNQVASNNNTNYCSKNSDYKIIFAQQVGKKYRYELEFQDGSTKWVPDSQVDPKILENFMKTKVNKTRSSNRANINTNLITLVLIFLYVLSCASGSQIADNFIHCQSRGPNRIVMPNPDCKHPKEIKKALSRHNSILDEILHRNKLPSDIYLVSRNKYYLNEIGYECSMTRRTTYLNKTWYFSTSRSEEKRTIHLTKLECLTLIESKECDKNKMKCNNDGCWHVSQPIEEYYYWSERKVETTDCSFHRKQVIAQFENSQLYFSPSNSCKANDEYCKLSESTVIWNNTGSNKCLLTKIHNGTNYTLTETSYFDQHNILYSTQDNLSFQITSAFYECNVRLFRTTTDMYIIIKNDPESTNHYLIDYTDSKISFNKQHDINNFLLSENDNEKRLTWLREQEKVHESEFEKCKEWQHVMSQVSKEEDKFNTVIDPNGQIQHVYTRNGLVYLPICTPVSEINLIESSKCFQHQPIWYLSESRQNRTGYLTQNNFIRDNSPSINCKLITSNQLLPSNNILLIRNGNQFTTKNTSNLIIHDLSKSYHIHSNLNLMHQNQIISNYQNNEIHVEYEKTSQDDNQFFVFL